MKLLNFSKLLFALPLILCVISPYAAPSSSSESADATTGAAMGYCLAKHPYRTLYRDKGNYTPEGFEIPSVLGIVGVVRRNFIYNRTSDTIDEGASNSCEKACVEFGKGYEPNYKGYALKQRVAYSGGNWTVINSGIGDMASMAVSDKDFYTNPPQKVTAGILSRANAWHEGDVAQADFCCCQVK